MEHDTWLEKQSGSPSFPAEPGEAGPSQNLPSRMEGMETAESGDEMVIIRDEVEFDVHDYDGRIQRYEERIRDGFCRVTFKEKIKSAKAAKEARAAIMAQFPGKSWNVINRIGCLQSIEKYLIKTEDPCKELLTVQAMMAAYENGELEWNDKTTYWCQGKKIAGPSIFSWEDFRTYNTEENRGDGGFWVEGQIYPLQPVSQSMARTATGFTRPQSQKVLFKHWVRLSRKCGAADKNGHPFPALELDFKDDTGADAMMIFYEDIQTMMGTDMADWEAPKNHLMGYERVNLADGSHRKCRVYAVDVNMTGVDENGKEVKMLDEWTTIPCLASDKGWKKPLNRLNGPWLRRVLYVGSAPKFPTQLYASTTKKGLSGPRGIPGAAGWERSGPLFVRPRWGVRWKWNAETNRHEAERDSDSEGMVLPPVVDYQ